MQSDDPTRQRDFEGNVAVVTGAGSGIGAATALAFARSGAALVLVDIDADGLARVQEESVAFGVPVAPFVLDVADEHQVDVMLHTVIAEHGRIDHLVNCAASFVAAGVDAKHEEWMRSLDVNVVGPAMLGAKASRSMPAGSTIVNVASISAHVAQPDRWTYNSTKAALLALTRGQALDLGKQGIRVNAVSPGWIWTEEVSKAANGDRATWEPVWGRFHILGRLGEAHEVADAILFLSGPRSTFITGSELLVDGGYSAIGPEGHGQSSTFAGTPGGDVADDPEQTRPDE
jgi:NAD(P)-dependent dehydrogenase (short-subunit alcohol dehydrogenase family)